MTSDDRIPRPPPPASARIDMNVWTQPFWDAAARRELAIPRCGACGTFRMPPTPFCPACRSQAIDWTAIDAGFTLYSYTIVERAIIPGTENALPYVPAIVELADTGGVRLISNIVDSPIGAIRIGAPLTLVWRDQADGIVLPQFRLA